MTGHDQPAASSYDPLDARLGRTSGEPVETTKGKPLRSHPARKQSAASPRWRNYEFDFPGYIEAVEEQQRLLRAATEASRKLNVANEIVKEFEDKLRQALENAMAESRVYAKERAGVQ